jgi:mannose-6-phosphate isomerase-like protein (cupin superfamily)
MLRVVFLSVIGGCAAISSVSFCAQQTQAPAAAARHPQVQRQRLPQATVTELSTEPADKYSWGTIHWLMSNKLDPDAEQTFGIVSIAAGQTNALHLHPNCEELMYILSGEGTTKVGGTVLPLRPGVLVRIPRGVLHQATASPSGSLVAAISYSSGNRQVVTPGTSHE